MSGPPNIKANAVFFYLRHGCSLTEIATFLGIRMRALRQLVRLGNWSSSMRVCSEYWKWREQA